LPSSFYHANFDSALAGSIETFEKGSKFGAARLECGRGGRGDAVDGFDGYSSGFFGRRGYVDDGRKLRGFNA
jgi:hypothetical protein